jgi:hypothetical protein
VDGSGPKNAEGPSLTARGGGPPETTDKARADGEGISEEEETADKDRPEEMADKGRPEGEGGLGEEEGEGEEEVSALLCIG